MVSEAQVQQHYRNNKKAAEVGVILQTFLPRSPFANAARLRWTEGEGEATEHVLALYVELRSYPQSRTETINRATMVVLQARAKSAADLALLEAGLDFESTPLPLN